MVGSLSADSQSGVSELWPTVGSAICLGVRFRASCWEGCGPVAWWRVSSEVTLSGLSASGDPNSVCPGPWFLGCLFWWVILVVPRSRVVLLFWKGIKWGLTGLCDEFGGCGCSFQWTDGLEQCSSGRGLLSLGRHLGGVGHDSFSLLTLWTVFKCGK